MNKKDFYFSIAIDGGSASGKTTGSKVIAKKFGFKFVDLNEYDFFTELQRSILIRKIIEYFPPSKFFFRFFGKKIPYIRMLKFKKM